MKRFFIAFLNKYCKPLMRFYYKKKYRKEIYKVLKLFYDYKEAGPIDIYGSVKILTLDKDNWTLDKAAKMVGICIYLGFLSNK